MSQDSQQHRLDRASTLVEREPLKALAIVQSLVDQGANDAPVLLVKARALVRCGRFLEAAMLLEQVVKAGGGNLKVYTLWVNTLLSAGAYSKLETVIDGFGEVASVDDFEFLNALVTASRFVGRTESTRQLVDHMVKNFPAVKGVVAQLGITNQSLGDTVGAESCFRQAIEQDPDRGLNRYYLSYNNKWSADKNNIDSLLDSLRVGASTGFDQALKYYALGKELEDVGEFDEAYNAYQSGAEQASLLVPYSVEADRRFFDAVKSGFATVERTSTQGFEADSPVFVLGMPRTGSTLIDTIISAHPQIYSAGELLTFREVLKLFAGYPGGGKDLEKFYSAAGEKTFSYAQVGEMYCTLARTTPAAGLRFTDKLPMNHVLLGVIALALPEAKFIYSDRGLLDICVSNFRQIFQAGFYPYSYDFEAIAHHCLMYRDLMNYWMEFFPESILKVDYEALVERPEEIVPGVVDFCGLSWDEGCLNFHETRTAVNTPSASQVRKPIYRSSVQQWRRFEKHLGPAIEVFERAGVDYL